MGIDRDVLVVGAGVFGLTAALELTARGHHVTVLDPGPLPSPLAASSDVSKVVRIEYGGDALYERLAERARAGWLRWNAESSGRAFYHEVGATFLTSRQMAPGGYEYENFQSLQQRGYAPERLSPDEIHERLPAWNAAVYIDGYFTDKAGYAESDRVMEWLVSLIARKAPPLLDRAESLLVEAGRVVGVRTRSHGEIRADHTLIAVGAWTPLLVPGLSGVLQSIGQPVFFLQPDDAALFSPPCFFVFGADSARTGWYGFPVDPRTGLIKIANHGPGKPVHPDEARVVPPEEVHALQQFLRHTFPALAAAPLAGTRCCLYCDTPDEDFLIGRHPDLPGLTVAAGDSGHAFKFAPVLGGLVADAVEGRDNAEGQRFAWRSFAGGVVRGEASRYHGDGREGSAPPASVELANP